MEDWCDRVLGSLPQIARGRRLIPHGKMWFWAMWQLRCLFRQLTKSLRNRCEWGEFWRVSRWKEGRNEINFKKHMSRYAQCACMGGIVDQVSHLMAYNFLALFRRAPVKGALNLLVVKDFFHWWSLTPIRGPKSPRRTTSLKDFRWCVLVSKREGTKNSKPRCTWIIWKWDIPWPWPLNPRTTNTWVVVASCKLFLSKSGINFWGKQFTKALSQWSHLESCHAIILEEFQDAASTETWGSKRVLWCQWSICDNMCDIWCVISVSFNYDVFWKWWQS